ncbi:MAG: hypothetical protein ACFFDP_11160 [Promethearchaeota archaeon]
MRSYRGLPGHEFLLKIAVTRLVTRARGPAQRLAVAAVEQLPKLITLGMPPNVALRETLHTAIYAAQLKSKHCVGSERHVYDDFIALCMEMESQTRMLSRT